MKLARTFFLISLILSFLAENLSYIVKKDKKTGKYNLIFNNSEPKKLKQPKKLVGIKTRQKKRKLISNNDMLGGALGAAAGAAVGGMLSGTSGIINQIAALKPKVRNLKMKNLVEKDNNSLLFKANMELRKIYGDLRKMRESFVFLLEKKKDMLIEVLPDVSV